jgi:hypothetical protein
VTWVDARPLLPGHAATVTVCYDGAVTDLFETLVS